MSFSARFYRLLVKLYPPRFREEYGSALERQFGDDYREAAAPADRARLWAQTAADLAVSVPAQFAQELGRDARQTFRLWARRPFHTGLAIAALAVGIGANTGVFSVLNALLLRSLPFREPDRIASIKMFTPGGFGVGPNRLHDWRKHSAYMEDAAQFGSLDVNLDGARESARIRLTETSWNFFSMLGSEPVLGRAFAAGEDTPGKDAVAVIGYGLWQQLYGGDRRVLGSTLRANGVRLTIIGVAPPAFDYPAKTAIWTTTTFDLSRIPKTNVYFVESIGRLRPGLTWAAARAAFEAEAYRRFPEARNLAAANRPALVPIEDQLAGPVKQATLVLMGGVALILLIACVNVAHFLLARTIDRSSELLIRAALGAGPARLSQQILTESLLLSGVAAVSGLIVAYWTAAVATAVQPAALAAQAYRILDWRVLSFAVALSFVTGLVFGVLPAVHVSRLRVSITALRQAGSSQPAGRVRRALIAAQVALAIILLAGSVALGRGFLALLKADTGYQTRNVVTLSVSLAGSTHRDQDRAATYYQEALRRVREVAGVESASAAEFLPLAAQTFMGGQFRIDDAGTPALATVVPVAPGYFQTMGGRVLYGREFQDGDGQGPEPVAIVNDQFARRFGDPAGMVGRQLTSGPPWKRPFQIIGVVRGMRYGLSTTASEQIFLLSMGPQFLTVVAKVRGRPQDRIPPIRAAVQSVDARVPVFDVKTMEERLDESLARPKFYTTAVLFFGGFALLLAATGIYGIASYTVAQRTREMGIRLALGTTAARVRGGLMKQGLLPVAVGALPGVAGAFAASRFLASLLPGAEPVSAMTCAAALAPVFAIAAAGIWSATRRIARLDLAETLRAE